MPVFGRTELRGGALRILDDLQHRGGVGRLLERGTKIFVVKQLCDIRERMQVFLKLALRHEEEHYQVNRLIIEGIEVYSLSRPAKRTDHFVNQIGRRMGNT